MMERLTHPALACDALVHGFFTRNGGVSVAPFASLNCGLASRDDPAAVAENLRRVAADCAATQEQLLLVRQTHSNVVITVEKPWDRASRPEADAMVTRQPNLALGIMTADCAPLLCYDAKTGIIGAAHAGWRGALAGIGENTVAAMARLGANPATITIIIGACIQQLSYEVGPEFLEKFLQQAYENQVFFKPSRRAGHLLFDLPGYLQHRLGLAGVGTIHSLGNDTFSDATRFFSYRRASLLKQTNGTLLSVIKRRNAAQAF